MKFRPVVLAVLDGWGCSESTHGNAIAAAQLPHWRAFFDRYPWTTLAASGEDVGLPKGIMGNSEVGHMNLGSGRVVPQGVVIIDADIASGEFAHNPTLQQCIEHVRASGGTLHFMGLVSDGKVHSSLDHLLELMACARKSGVPFTVHAFLDGRDTPPRSAERYLSALDGHVSTVIGRYYAMDRDKRWERTELAYDAIARGRAPFRAPSALQALADAYARGEDDEFVKPTFIDGGRSVHSGDACIFFNFRPDRARQLTLAFAGAADVPFACEPFGDVLFATMTKYDETFPNPVLFGPRPQFETFGEVVARAGLRQLRLAETEKYAHVTYFFNGGREDVFEGEERTLVPSDRSVATYDLAPKMRAPEITQRAVTAVAAGTYEVIVMNYANADMVGHTGKWEPTIAAVEELDGALAQLADAVLTAGGLLAITADHGNAEEKIDAQGNPLTAHTTNRVPLLLIADGLDVSLRAGGRLADVAPTLLQLMQLPIPDAMNGRSLVS